MAQRQTLAHFETFARLHRAHNSDLSQIVKFCARLSPDADPGEAWWRGKLGQDDAYVLIATECQLIVGIAAIEHAPSAPEARVVFLCVAPDARGRGVGQLLLSTLVGRARSEGAAQIRAFEGGQQGVAIALRRAGFSELGGGTWCFGLWNAHAATGFSDMLIPEHEPVAPDQAAAQSLLMAMGTLDNSMLLTHQARRVIEHELRSDVSKAPGAGELALAAARRRYFVRLDTDLAESTRLQCLPDVSVRIGAENDRITPERVLGHISRAQLCLLRLVVQRLSGSTPVWYLVNGFDGYLFRLHDVTRANDPGDPLVITASELRLILGRLTPQDHLSVAKLL